MSGKVETFAGSAEDPVFVAELLNTLIREVNILKNVTCLSMQIGTSILSAVSALNDERLIGKTTQASPTSGPRSRKSKRNSASIRSWTNWTHYAGGSRCV